MQRRAEEFAALAAAGKAGVSLGRDINIDDLTTTLGDALNESEESHSVIEEAHDDHEDHGHEDEGDDHEPDTTAIEEAASDAVDLIEGTATSVIETVVPEVENAVQEALPNNVTPAGADDNPEPNQL